MDQSKALQANYVGEWHPILKKECTQEFSVLELLQFMEENSNILSNLNPDNLRFTVRDAPTSNYRVIIIYEIRP